MWDEDQNPFEDFRLKYLIFYKEFWQASFYYTLPAFIGSQSGQRTIKGSRGPIRQMNARYLYLESKVCCLNQLAKFRWNCC